MLGFEKYYHKVYQIPIDVVAQRFPHLGLMWKDARSRWYSFKEGGDYHSLFCEAQSDALSKEMFQESKRAPNIDKYQDLERRGFKACYGDSFQAQVLPNGWMLNRGKISYTRLAWMMQFEQRGIFWYPKGGYREWHTNHPYDGVIESAGWRLYLIDVDGEGESYFNYLDASGRLHRVLDKPLYANVFYLPPVALFWHSVVSNGDRFSCGFRPIGPAVQTLTQLIEEYS